MSIAAASIVAKIMRDALMRNLGLEYPQYGFAEHVGYATVGTAGRWRPRARVPTTGARSGSNEENSDPQPKKVSKELKSYIR